MPYVVTVDDNANFMDESRRYMLGEFDSAEHALYRCRRIVDGFLLSSHIPGYTTERDQGSEYSFGS